MPKNGGDYVEEDLSFGDFGEVKQARHGGAIDEIESMLTEIAYGRSEKRARQS